jgi:Xaa-Pro dipeptidase
MTAASQPSLAQPISAEEHRARRETLLAHPAVAGVDGLVWWGSHRVFYLSGFAFVPTERPIALVIAGSGETVLFVPRLEREHAETYAHVDRVVTYPEFPDEVHPMRHLASLLQDLGITARFGGDGDGYPKVMGYRGPALSTVSGAEFTALDDVLEEAMQVKSAAEVALIRESARWAGRAHRLLQELTREGRTETEVEIEVMGRANAELLAAYDGRYRALSWGISGPHAGYRGQIGAHSALPHSLNIGAVFQPGDTLVTGASCPMFGYWSELERTMFLESRTPSSVATSSTCSLCRTWPSMPVGQASRAAASTPRCAPTSPSTACSPPGVITPATTSASGTTRGRSSTWGTTP